MAIETEIGAGGGSGGSSAFQSTTGVSAALVVTLIDGIVPTDDQLAVMAGGVDGGGNAAPLEV